MTRRAGTRRAVSSGFGGPSHLARRFVGSLWPGGPPPPDEAWARSFLTEGEQTLWARLSGADRRHAVSVARRLVGSEPGELAAVPAALLHDVGKVASRFGPLRRAATTALAVALGRRRLARGRGPMARYLRHDALGAQLLERAGSDRLTISWAREHHLPAERWTVPQGLGQALKAADDGEPGGWRERGRGSASRDRRGTGSRIERQPERRSRGL